MNRVSAAADLADGAPVTLPAAVAGVEPGSLVRVRTHQLGSQLDFRGDVLQTDPDPADGSMALCVVWRDYGNGGRAWRLAVHTLLDHIEPVDAPARPGDQVTYRGGLTDLHGVFTVISRCDCRPTCREGRWVLMNKFGERIEHVRRECFDHGLL